MVIDGKILSKVCSKLMADVKYWCRGCVRRAEALVYLVVYCGDDEKETVDTFGASLRKRRVCEPAVNWVTAIVPIQAKQIIESSMIWRKNSGDEKGAKN